MKKYTKIAALALAFAFVGPNIAFADTKIDQKIEELKIEEKKLQEEYDSIYETYSNIQGKSKAYISKSGQFVTNEEAIRANLYNVSSQLDNYVTNVIPSIESAMLSVNLSQGARLNGYEIRANNAEDLYKYVKSYFVMKEGTDKEVYDKLLISYVNAISDSVVLPKIDQALKPISEKLQKQKEKLDRVSLELKYYKREKNKDSIEMLNRAIKKAEIQLESCYNLIKFAPKTVAKVRYKLDGQIKDQEELIKKAKLALAQYY
ncbi:hypothetical protein [Anaerococcus kampingiae]|uniref:cAMP factor (Cfa) n=1 Tax=Anaerococcus kampingae TaxID=3115614 RepID=A0ABW9MDD4_9FIRM